MKIPMNTLQKRFFMFFRITPYMVEASLCFDSSAYAIKLSWLKGVTTDEYQLFTNSEPEKETRINI